jgi:putative flippase GtrA
MHQSPMKAHFKSATWFTLVGIAAATTHYIVAVSLDMFAVLPVLTANLIGFLVAFPVSYVGHYRLSFKNQSPSSRTSLWRFLCVAVLGFVMNQLLILVNLNVLGLPFWFVLGIVLLLIAISTYVLSLYWAFK